MSEFLTNYDSKNLAKDKTYFKNPENPRCINLFITNSSDSFQNTTTMVNDLDVHKMIVTVCKNYFQKSKPKEIVHRNNKNFDINTFKFILRLKLQTIKIYEPFEQVFLETLKQFQKANHVSYMTKSLRKAIMRRHELEGKYLKIRTIENRIKL